MKQLSIIFLLLAFCPAVYSSRTFIYPSNQGSQACLKVLENPAHQTKIKTFAEDCKTCFAKFPEKSLLRDACTFKSYMGHDVYAVLHALGAVYSACNTDDERTSALKLIAVQEPKFALLALEYLKMISNPNDPVTNYLESLIGELRALDNTQYEYLDAASSPSPKLVYKPRP